MRWQLGRRLAGSDGALEKVEPLLQLRDVGAKVVDDGIVRGTRQRASLDPVGKRARHRAENLDEYQGNRGETADIDHREVAHR